MRSLALPLLALFVFVGPAFPAAKRNSSRTTKSSRHAPVPSGSHYNIPAGPTQDRYREIQQALADKGYYTGEVNGRWTPDCTAALKRFQAEQNLQADGRLGSLSLIALGLGPKRTLNVQAAPVKP